MAKQIVKEKEKEVYEEERRKREQDKKKWEKKKEQSKSKQEIKRIVKEREMEYASPKKVDIPVMEADKTVIEPKDFESEKKAPSIARHRGRLIVPLVELEKPRMELKEIELDHTLPKIVSKERKLMVPVIKLKKPRSVISLITTFDERLPHIRENIKMLKIPIYRPSKPVIREIISSFDGKVDTKILRNLVVESRREKIIQERRVAEAIVPEGAPSGGEEEFEELPDIVEFVFGVSNTEIISKYPIIVLYKELENDSTIGSFETLCIRIFREEGVEAPSYFSIKKLDDFNIREIEKYIKPEGNIVRIDLDSLKRDGINISEIISSEHLKETLGRFVVGGLSFLIFKTRDEKLYDQCKEVIEWLKMNIEHPLKILEIIPKTLTIEQKRILTELAWGLSIGEVNSGIKAVGDRPIGTTLDDIFNKFGKPKHEEYLKKLENEKEGRYAQVTRENEGGESDLHLNIKWFIVKNLSEKYKLSSNLEIEECIRTEEPLKETNINGEMPIPDIWDIKENTVYEVETLFSQNREGKSPQKKIYDSIKKYDGTSIRKINIVLDNLSLLLHIREIFGVKKNIKEWEDKSGKIVDFLTLDVENCKLVSINEIVKKYKPLDTSKS